MEEFKEAEILKQKEEKKQQELEEKEYSVEFTDRIWG